MASNDVVFRRENSAARIVDALIPPISDSLTADASPTIVWGTDARVLRYTTTLTGNRTITCSNTGAVRGAHFRIVRIDTAAQTLTILDNAAATIKIIPNSTAAFVDVVFNGTDWKLVGYGAL